MVRQWQQLLHGERYRHSYSASLPDFVKLAEAYGGVGIRADTRTSWTTRSCEMIDTPKPGDLRLPGRPRKRTASR